MAGLVKSLASSRYGMRTPSRRSGGQVARALGSSAAASVPQTTSFYKPLAASSPTTLTHNEEATGGTQFVPAPAQPNTQNPGSGGTRPPAAPPGTQPVGDFSGDPVYQSVLALTQRGGQDAQSAATAQRNQELIQHGYDPTLDTSGADRALYGDPNVLAAAQANPFSTVANLRHGFEGNLNTIADALNSRNLFYGSARADQEANAGRDFQAALSEAAGTRNQHLSAIAAALVQALQDQDAQRIAAEQAAYDRTLANPADIAPPVPPPPPPGPIGGYLPDGAPMVAPPVVAPMINPMPNVDLAAIANSLYPSAGGGTGARRPVTSVTPRRRFA